MSNLYEIDPERRALFGYNYGGSYRGWFDILFEDYALYPYMNIARDQTKDLLYRKTLLSKLVPIFAKQLRITNILNRLIHFDLLSDKSAGPGLIEELAKVITEEVESRKTLNDRLQDVDKRLGREKKLFSGMTYEIFDREANSVLKDRTGAAEGSLIAVEGILNHIQAVAGFDRGLARTFEGSGIEWILADFPYFDLAEANKYYDGNVVGLRMDEAIASTLTKFPFDKQLGWYPYVTVYGVFHSSSSAENTQIKVVDWCWMKWRQPKSYVALPSTLQDVLDESAKNRSAETDIFGRTLRFQPWLDFTRHRDIIMFLAAIQIANLGGKLDYELVRDDTKALAQRAYSAAKEPIPTPIAAYFGFNPVPGVTHAAS